MDEYDGDNVLDIVRGLQGVDIDISAPVRDEEKQGGENIRLNDDF